MSPCFILGRENVPCVAEVVNRSLKADCTDFNSRKHRCKHVSDSVPSSFDTREHFDYNIASLTGIVFNCSVSSSCNDRSNH